MKVIRIFISVVLLMAIAIVLPSCGKTTAEPSADLVSSKTEPTVVKDTSSTETTETKTDDSVLRVMSYNILHPDWGGVPVYSRAEDVAAVFERYAPDVIGVQEACWEWHDYLKPLIVDTGAYKPVCQRFTNTTYNLTTMFYNPNTVTLLEHFIFSLKENTDIRVVACGVFEKAGKRFIVINTHPDTPLNEDSTYASDIENIIKHVQELKKEYEGMPIIMTGDYNSPKNLDFLYTGYNDIVTNLEVNDTRDVAEVVENNYETMPGLYGTPTPYEGGMSIKIVDYIFVTKDVTVKKFGVAIDEKLTWLSDHLPIYADISLE